MGITIEAGKNYVTRDGLKARIYATDGGKEFPIHGAALIQIKPPVWDQCVWSQNGNYLHSADDHYMDIIGPWIEKPIVDWSVMPKWAKYAAKDKDGKWFWYVFLPLISSSDSVNWELKTLYFCGFIPKEFSPQFDGDWTQSLVERPTP